MNDISDHLPNFLIIKNFSKLSKVTNEKYARDYSRITQNKIVNDIQAIDWNLSNCETVDNMFENIYNQVSQVIDLHSPLKKLSKTQAKFLSKPWITTGLKTSIKKKNMLYKKYRRQNNPYNP